MYSVDRMLMRPVWLHTLLVCSLSPESALHFVPESWKCERKTYCSNIATERRVELFETLYGKFPCRAVSAESDQAYSFASVARHEQGNHSWWFGILEETSPKVTIPTVRRWQTHRGIFEASVALFMPWKWRYLRSGDGRHTEALSRHLLPYLCLVESDNIYGQEMAATQRHFRGICCPIYAFFL